MKLFRLVLLFLPPCILAQEPTCPKKPGLYSLADSKWTEIPREAVPVNAYSPGVFGANVTKQMAGEKAFVEVRNPAKFCVSGTTSAATFSLEKAKIKHRNREFVQSGSFRIGKDNQSQSLASITDESDFTHLLVNELSPGQYVIWMHGSFQEPIKSGSNPGDPSAAMAAAIAAAQAVSMGTQGFLFAFGIDK